MIFAKVETEEAKKELQSALSSAKKSYLYRRLLIIQLSSEGKTVPELVSMFTLTEVTVRQYIHDYNDGGLDRLFPKKKPGRKAKFSLSKDQWNDIFHQSPSSFDKLQTANSNWTLELLATYIKEYHGVSMSLSGIWYQLRKAKISMGRSKLEIPKKDLEYTVKRQRVLTLKKKAETGELTSDDVTIVDPGLMPIAQRKKAVLLYFDETNLQLRCLMRTSPSLFGTMQRRILLTCFLPFLRSIKTEFALSFCLLIARISTSLNAYGGK